MSETATPITDHTDQALGKLISRFQRRPRFAAWVASDVDQVQDIEDAAWIVNAAWDVDTCDETRLRILGAIVGQPPLGTVEQYRTYIKARIKINRSRGRIVEILQIARLLLGPVVYDEPGEAYFYLEATNAIGDLDANTAASLLREAKAAGVGFHLIYNNVPAADRFVFGYLDPDDIPPEQSPAYLDDTEGGKADALA